MNSIPNISLEELALQTKSVTRLTINFGVDTCKLCNIKSNSEWQVTEFDNSWGFLCGSMRNRTLRKTKQKRIIFKFHFFVASYFQLTRPKPINARSIFLSCSRSMICLGMKILPSLLILAGKPVWLTIRQLTLTVTFRSAIPDFPRRTKTGTDAS